MKSYFHVLITTWKFFVLEGFRLGAYDTLVRKTVAKKYIVYVVLVQSLSGVSA